LASRVINKEIEQVAIDLLKHHPRNANNGDVEAIKKSLAVNGWYGAVVANLTTKHILAGNHRVMAAKALGWETVPVQWVDVTPEEELRILVVDNRTTRIGQDDTTKITDILAELANTPIGLEGTGYGEADLDALIDSLTGTGEPEELLTDPDEVPEVVETRCQPGDLWILGSHRLLCGDSTKPDDVERLMGGKQANMVFTDPPYGMNLDTDYSNMGTSKTKYKKIHDDDKPFDAGAMMNLLDAPTWYIWGADYFCNSIPIWSDGSTLIWAKAHSEDENKVFGSSFEVCWRFPKAKKEVWFVRRIHMTDEHLKAHPTQKPTALPTRAIEKDTVQGDVVVDLYGGSGTTLIACESTNRVCHMNELDPHYCDVIIQRWENATGKKAVLDEG
jgi:DNA modification methylase